MSGAIAAAQMDIPQEFAEKVCKQLPLELRKILSAFYSRFKLGSERKENNHGMTEEDEALSIVVSPTDEDETNGGLETVIPAPMRASKQKAKGTTAKGKKTSQRGKEDDVVQDLKLTDENKASKKEMLSIKSGVLLDDILKG